MSDTIAVFGSTGYIGSRLVMELMNQGYTVRATYRNEKKLKQRVWYDHPQLETVYCDIMDPETIIPALKGVKTAFYLIHSMGTASDNYPDMEKRAARNMIQGARVNNTQIIYLGGLGNEKAELSKHLRSRIEVGKLFVESDVPCTVLRASVIVGSGSASFEILRHLVEKLPAMITPNWVRTVTQPIAVRNVIDYLIQCIGEERVYNKVLDIGGPDVVTFNDLMQTYAKVAGLNKRVIIPVPMLSPTMSARWVRFITPVDTYIATELVEGLKNETIVENDEITSIIPLNLISMEEAMRRALSERSKLIFKHSYDDIVAPVEWQQKGDSGTGDFVRYDRRVLRVRGDRDALWNTISSIGGSTGWYYGDYLWKIRGFLDEIVGGVGMRRGRTHPTDLKQGDVIDCWRVKRVVQGEELILEAEMKLPGIASLKFGIIPQDDGTFILEQNALFVPQGLLGLLYWKLVEPLHMSVFAGMLNAIAQKSGLEIVDSPLLIERNRKITTKFSRIALPA
ncbi:MAG: SDR family oxidoreductase [Candidatus Kariarchaeaceae archaeon]|jgi:uncharacterized protein YbjT (DUF2867 family)